MSKDDKMDKPVDKPVAPQAPAVNTIERWWSKGKNFFYVISVNGLAESVKFKDHKLTLNLDLKGDKLISEQLHQSSRIGLDFSLVKNVEDCNDINAYADTLRQLLEMPEPELRRLFEPEEFEKLGMPLDGGDRYMLIAGYMRSKVLSK